MHYCSAIKTMEALVKRRPFPERFWVPEDIIHSSIPSPVVNLNICKNNNGNDNCPYNNKKKEVESDLHFLKILSD